MDRARVFIVVTVLLSFSFTGWASEVEVAFVPQKIYQGKTAAIYVEPDDPYDDVSVIFLGKKVKCYLVGGKFRGLIGVQPDQRPGEYQIEVSLEGSGLPPRKITQRLKVLPTRFSSVWFRLKPAKKKLYVRDLIQEEWAQIEQTLVKKGPEQGWSDKFSLPVEGPVSMAFGAVEHINGKKTGQHRGMDLAVPTGTAVNAPENGKVVFAETLKAFGGTVVLDHGQGVHSLYFHLSKVLARVGEKAGKGETIALTGNSGISTGPHLHWGISVNNVRVDPRQWTKYAF